MAKDLFSSDSKSYAQFRPRYPKELFEYIISFVKEKNMAWDCATGNGQAATELANYFKIVQATDISQSQLDNATKKENIVYGVSTAEKTHFANDRFDLITVATAYHWFNHSAFYTEASRVGKNGCVVAVWTYTTLQTRNEKVAALYQHFYNHITGPYWEPERRFVDNSYQTIPFQFEALLAQPFATTVHWTRDQFLGYLNTWSAVQKYTKMQGASPIFLLEKELKSVWPENETLELIFPLSLRLGRIAK